MKTLEYTITDESGIHARPAGVLVNKMKEFVSTVIMTKGSKTGNGKKLFEVMRLGVKCNDIIIITAEGPDEEEAIAAAKGILETIL